MLPLAQLGSLRHWVELCEVVCVCVCACVYGFLGATEKEHRAFCGVCKRQTTEMLWLVSHLTCGASTLNGEAVITKPASSPKGRRSPFFLWGIESSYFLIAVQP